MSAGSRIDSFGRVPSADRRNPVEDPETRRKAQRTVLCATVVVLAAGIFVWLASLPFDDPPEIRKVVASIVIGLGGALLAVRVLQGMAKEVVVGGEPPYEHVQPEPVLVLAGVDLRDAALPGVELGRSELTGALLTGADLNATTLQASRLAGADLGDADLRGADLRLTDLRDSNLRGTDLRATDLRGALLSGARFDGAIYNEATNWPEEPPPGSIHVKEAHDPEP
jgi:hypothetical protein